MLAQQIPIEGPSLWEGPAGHLLGSLLTGVAVKAGAAAAAAVKVDEKAAVASADWIVHRGVSAVFVAAIFPAALAVF